MAGTGDEFVIGVAVGMEFVNDVMHIDTSWTTAVCLKDGQVVAKTQTMTNSTDVFDSIKVVLKNLLEKIKPGIKPVNVTRINIATPQLLNEVLKKNLSPVSVVRLCGPTTQTLLPFVNIPDDIKPKLMGDVRLLNGGYELCETHGANEPITPVNVAEVLQCIEDIGQSKCQNVVICGVYSPDDADQEYQVGQLFQKQRPNLNVTLSHQVVNKIGLLDRENTSILTAGLQTGFKEMGAKFYSVLQELNLRAPFYFVENDANLVRGNNQTQFPVKTFFGVQASVMRSSTALITDLNAAIVINIGGTVSTAGILKDGKAVLQTPTINISGVKVFKDAFYTVTSNIGMFSRVHYDGQSSLKSIGPDSVESYKDALVFGGKELTCLDIAVAAKLITFGDPEYVKNLDADLIKQVLREVPKSIEDLIDDAKESPQPIPVVLVGIGSVLIDEKKPLKGASEVHKPLHAEVAAAVGAAVIGEQQSFHVTGVAQTESGSRNQLKQHAFLRLTSPRPRNEALVDCSRQSFSRVTAHKDVSNAEEYKPLIQGDEWLLSETDLEYISLGAGILGSGGGGSPELGKLMAIDKLKKGKKIRVKVPETMSKSGLVVITALMGSPGVLLEKYPNGSEGVDSVACLQDVYNCGYKKNASDIGSISWKPAGTVDKYTDGGTVKYIQEFPLVYNPPVLPQEQSFEGLIPVESGGVNTIQALNVAAETDNVVLDCDGQGRAIPSLQMIGPTMYGSPLYPASLSGGKGQRVVALSAKTATDLEIFFRNQTVQIGSISAVTFAPLTRDIVNTRTVKYTISKSWRIGKAIRDAQKQGQDPIQSILDLENGIFLLKDGKITTLKQTNVGGFTVGRFTLSNGTDTVTVDYQNENLVAWKGEEADIDVHDPSKVLGTIPDIISIVDDKGQPLTTEVLYCGLRLSVIAMPCSPLLKSPQALKFIGPKAVGYDFDYKPLAGNPKYQPAIPVPPLPKHAK